MAKTKEKIAESFKKLVLKKSFTKITITDIAKESGMTRENFYYHFHDKYDIVSWIFREEIGDQLSNDDMAFPEWFIMLIHRINNDYQYYKRICKAIDMTNLESELTILIKNRITSCVEHQYPDGQWNPVSDRKQFVIDFFTKAFSHWLIESVLEHEYPDEESDLQGLQFLFDNFMPFVRISK